MLKSAQNDFRKDGLKRPLFLEARITGTSDGMEGKSRELIPTLTFLAGPEFGLAAPLTASPGVASMRGDCANPEILLERSDAAP
jgi:hypothetical protein